MNLLFFCIALTMILTALSFPATPLVLSYSKNNAGFAKFPLLAIIVVLSFAIALYAAIGRPGLESQTSAADTAGMPATQPQAAQPRKKAASIETLLSGLEQRLHSNPDDGEDWLLLAKSYEHVGRYADALDAYTRAIALGVTDEALGARLGDSDESLPAGATAEILGRLSYSQSVAGRISPGDVVFITAKIPGNPMPLAVLRRSASELPFDFVLNDEASMVKGSGISSASEIIVTAKISKSGDALNTGANLQATAGPVDPGSAGYLELVISAATDAE
jgi:cytochrome c-type biogenesis protein CcmH